MLHTLLLTAGPVLRLRLAPRFEPDCDRMEQYLPFLAAVETYDNGKRSARRISLTFRWRKITSVISRVVYVPRKAHSVSSMTTPSRITSTSRSAWSVRSFPGIFPS